MIHMGSKPLFTWVPAPDGRKRSGRELVDYCVTVQEFFFLLRERRMDRDQAERTHAELLVDMRSTLKENGVRVIEPQWFASLLR